MKLEVGRAFKKAGLKLKKHSPEILIILGVGGVVVSAIGACKATLKLGDIVDEAKERIDDIHMRSATDEDYPENEIKKDLAKTYFKYAGKVIVLYAPSVLGGVASIGCILGSHHILKDRLNSTVAAYNILDASYKGYQKRVAEKLGDDEERKLRYGIEKKEYEETITGKDGKEKTKKHKEEVMDPLKAYSQYARIFDCGCKGWEDNPEYNLMFLRSVQQHATDKLLAEGWLCLNDVYDMLGFPRTKQGQVVGWIKGFGDDFVDFGIYNTKIEKNRDFVNGFEPVIILDFNVDGYILDKI